GMRSPAELNVADYPIVGGASSDLFPWPNVKDNANVFGARAVAIPGVVAGMDLAHRTWGTRPWADMLVPAIAEAQAGLEVDWYAQLVIASVAPVLAQYPASRATFLDAQGFPKSSAWTALGETRCDMSALAATLSRIAEAGPDDFYRGTLAAQLVGDLRAAGGRHSAKDFAQYQARILPASESRYRRHRMFSTPELTAGPTMEHVLSLLERWQPMGTAPDAQAYIAYDNAILTANAQRLSTMFEVEAEPAYS
ncbi:MAG: gamma-glutamyltransferase, partial [Litoreibacter sp.]|nr:gamma-glutamyltransferase [Litoreibacter sp.]